MGVGHIRASEASGQRNDEVCWLTAMAGISKAPSLQVICWEVGIWISFNSCHPFLPPALRSFWVMQSAYFPFFQPIHQVCPISSFLLQFFQSLSSSSISFRRPLCPSQLCFWHQIISKIPLILLALYLHLLAFPPANLLTSSPNQQFTGLKPLPVTLLQCSSLCCTDEYGTPYNYYTTTTVCLSIESSYP